MCKGHPDIYCRICFAFSEQGESALSGVANTRPIHPSRSPVTALPRSVPSSSHLRELSDITPHPSHSKLRNTKRENYSTSPAYFLTATNVHQAPSSLSLSYLFLSVSLCLSRCRPPPPPPSPSPRLRHNTPAPPIHSASRKKAPLSICFRCCSQHWGACSAGYRRLRLAIGRGGALRRRWLQRRWLRAPAAQPGEAGQGVRAYVGGRVGRCAGVGWSQNG